jgi:hypothetical protein
MTPIVQLEKKLKDLETVLRERGETHIKFDQQPKVKENMYFVGGNGRMYIQPVADCFDISLSGKDLTKNLTGEMEKLCGPRHGYKQANKKLGKQDQPYWRVIDFNLVKAALDLYAKTKK